LVQAQQVVVVDTLVQAQVKAVQVAAAVVQQMPQIVKVVLQMQ
jgi:hypothetical protein